MALMMQENIALDAGGVPCSVLADEDEEHGPWRSRGIRPGLEPGDRFAQEERGEEHREHGDDGGDDRGVDGRGERQPPRGRASG